jgi:hypothetical protein
MPSPVSARSASSTDANANFCAADGSYVEVDEPTSVAPAPGPVLLCQRPVNIQLPGYLTTIADVFGIDRNHWWLKTDHVEFGMGPAPGAADEWGAPSVQVDQTDSHVDPRAICTPVDPAVDPACVESFYAPGTDTGAWKWPWNTCRTYVADILEHCRAEPNPGFDGQGRSL